MLFVCLRVEHVNTTIYMGHSLLSPQSNWGERVMKNTNYLTESAVFSLFLPTLGRFGEMYSAI